MTRIMPFRPLLAVVVAIMLLAGPDSARAGERPPGGASVADLPPYVPRKQVVRTIRIWGLSQLERDGVAASWAAAFRRFHPHATLEFNLPTGLSGMSGLITGAADIAASPRPWFAKLLGFQREFGYFPTEIMLATGAYDLPASSEAHIVAVHKDNPLGALTLAQLDGIFGAARTGGWVGTRWNPGARRGPEKNIRTWGQLGLTGEWANRPINVYGLTARSGSSVDFADQVLQGGDKWNENLRTYARAGGKRARVQMMRDLERDRYGIALTTAGYPAPGTKPLAIARSEGEAAVTPSQATINARQYPLTRTLSWYVNRKPGELMDPDVREFLRFALSREGQAAIVQGGRYLPLTAAMIASQRGVIDGVSPVKTPKSRSAGGAGPIRDALELQHMRNARIAARGARRHYTQDWDLGGLPAYKPGKPLTGTLRLWGLAYLAESRLRDLWVEGFRQYHPDVVVETHLRGATAAIPALVTRQADLVANSSLWHFDRVEFQRTFGYPPLEIEMVTGSFDIPGWAYALAVFVHPDNPLSSLSVAQLDGIFGAARNGGWDGTRWQKSLGRGPEKNIRTWGDLGLTGVWKDKPINIYAVNLRQHTMAGLSDEILAGSDKWNEQVQMFASYARGDGTHMVAQKQMMEALARDPYGISIGGHQHRNVTVKLLEIAATSKGPAIPLTIDHARTRRYPLTKVEYWNINRKPGAPIDPIVREFVRYTLSREGQAKVVEDGKFLPLTSWNARKQLSRLQ